MGFSGSIIILKQYYIKIINGQKNNPLLMALIPSSLPKQSQIQYKEVEVFDKNCIKYKIKKLNIINTIYKLDQQQSVKVIKIKQNNLQQQKMKDQTFLNNLIDFKDVKKTTPKNQLQIIGEIKSRDSFQSKSSVSVAMSAAQLDLDTHNTDKLLKNFKELREQLKQTTKNNQRLRIKIEQKQTQVERLKANQRQYITSNHQMKNQVNHLKQINQDLKAKLEILKNMTRSANQAQQQIQYLKISINEYKNKISSLQNQRNKLLEMSIVEKVQLQQKIKKYEGKKISDLQYVQEMEIQVSKLREKCIKQQNQLKKMQIKYDQELYNKQWNNGSFEKQHLQDQLRQADAQNQQLLSKHKKEKQRRNNLQKRVIQLEQTTGLWVVKAQTYESQNKVLQKKYKQIGKKLQQLKEQSSKKVSQVLSLQQKFMKSLSIIQELISRVKRQLYGDIVALAKSCQFKLGKLKQQKQGFFKNNNKQNDQLRKSASQLKLRSKSKQKVRFNDQKDQQNTQQKPTFINLRDKFQQCYAQRSNTEMAEHVTAQKTKNTTPNAYSQSESSRSVNALSQIENIEVRIKKQRDQMQKKIREKMLYRKLQVANSPEKHQLREDYFRLFQS